MLAWGLGAAVPYLPSGGASVRHRDHRKTDHRDGDPDLDGLNLYEPNLYGLNRIAPSPRTNLRNDRLDCPGQTGVRHHLRDGRLRDDLSHLVADATLHLGS